MKFWERTSLKLNRMVHDLNQHMALPSIDWVAVLPNWYDWVNRHGLVLSLPWQKAFILSQKITKIIMIVKVLTLILINPRWVWSYFYLTKIYFKYEMLFRHFKIIGKLKAPFLFKTGIQWHRFRITFIFIQQERH